MKTTLLRMIVPALSALAILAAGASPARAQASRGALAPGTFAVTGVSVVPMTADTVVQTTTLQGATVLVRDGRIVAVGPSGSVAVPPGARRIDGSGRYLIPGLADLHTHLFADDDLPDSLAAYELGVMLANGVTATRLMIGTPEHLALRRAVAEGRVAGPQLWVASPQLTGGEAANSRRVTTPDEARAAVREVAAAGYDFVKLTLDISPPVYDAIVDEARERGIPVVGHVDPRVGVRRALAAGQHVEHLDNYLESVLADDAPMRTSVSDLGLFRRENWESLDYVDDAKIAEIARVTAAAGTWTTPTLTMFKHAFALGPTEDDLRARPEWRLLTPKHRDLYLRAHRRYWADPPGEARRRRYVDVRNRLVKAIADAGGGILAGSDTPEWFFGYGFTLHRELESLVAAGLTPYQALAAATRNAAAFFGASAEWGTIEPGKRADFILLAADPLEDIRNTTRIEGVSMGGRWYTQPELQAMLDAAAAGVGGE